MPISQENSPEEQSLARTIAIWLLQAAATGAGGGAIFYIYLMIFLADNAEKVSTRRAIEMSTGCAAAGVALAIILRTLNHFFCHRNTSAAITPDIGTYQTINGDNNQP